MQMFKSDILNNRTSQQIGNQLAASQRTVSKQRVPLVVGENCCCAIIYAVAVNLVGGCKIKGSR